MQCSAYRPFSIIKTILNIFQLANPYPNHPCRPTTHWSTCTVAAPLFCPLVFGGRRREESSTRSFAHQLKMVLQPTLCSQPTRATTRTLSLSPPSSWTNQSLSMGPTCPNRPTLHSLGFKAADHPSPSFLAHSAPLTLPYQFLRPDLKPSTHRAEESKVFLRCCKLSRRMATDLTHLCYSGLYYLNPLS
jgi:hypothetical protein